MSRLKEVLESKEKNYILPFFWQHGEDEMTLRKYMEQIYESGMKAICIEARPHPDFAGDGWWKDLDIILDEAKSRNMKVWILDDSHFPTGYANGKVAKDYPELKKTYLTYGRIDVVGPMRGSSYLVGAAADFFFKKGKIIGVVAGEKVSSENNTIDSNTLVDVTKFVKDDVLYWDTPDGNWSIFVILETRKGGEEQTKDYLNPLIAEGTQILIDEVYESHYSKYKDEFGKTIAGFFSDEPRFGNIKGMYATMGKDMVLPWSPDVLGLLKKEFGENVMLYLPFLWNNSTKSTETIRYIYMNVVSELYSKNFSEYIGDWCKKHNVEYIGHVIEDNNAHARLGYGAGHYFRSLRGADMAGLDFVLGQIVPGLDGSYIPAKSMPGWDGEFFHYGLGKLGSSLAHLDSKKQGRTMCEMFGAYGWVEGLKLMKWTTDHMLVRGINYFVPHAFNPKAFPDWDCPPHFYAHGCNPQFRYYSTLTNYMNKMAHLLNDGIPVIEIGLLYHAEAEWSGDAMLYQKPAKQLMQNQIDFDVITSDVLVNEAIIHENVICAGKQKYKVLVIPEAQYLPYKLLEKINEYVKNGVSVVFVNSLPVSCSEDKDCAHILNELKENTKVVSLSSLVEEVKGVGIEKIETSKYVPYLRAYHYKHNNEDIFMLFNEEPYKDIEVNIKLPTNKKIFKYDALSNRVFEVTESSTANKAEISLHLNAYESVVYITAENEEELGNIESERKNILKKISLKEDFKVSISDSLSYPNFEFYKEINELKNLSAYNELPNFSGTFAYKTELLLEKLEGIAVLDLGDVYETAQVFVNGKNAGVRICKPYHFDISDILIEGVNEIQIEVTNTLVKDQKDMLSQGFIQEPSGLLGPINIMCYEQ